MTAPERVLRVDNAFELLEAKREGRKPVPEAVVDEWPARFVARVLESSPREESEEDYWFDGREQ